MGHLNGWIIECPKCHHKACGDEFEPSLSDECWCPKCGEGFLFEYPEDESEEDETGPS